MALHMVAREQNVDIVARAARKDARYLLVAEALQHRIKNQEPDSPLPAEHELARQFGVSRVTIRRALGLLERSGLVSRERGRGTTVNPSKITRWLLAYSFEEDLRRRGIKFDTHVVSYRPREVPPEVVAQRMGLPETARVGLLALLRLVDDRVVCYDRRYLPPGISVRFDPVLLERRFLQEIVEELGGMQIREVDWETEIVSASRDIANALHITPGVLVLVNSGLHSFEDGTPAQFVVMSYRIDRVKFRFTIDRQSGKSPAAIEARPSPSGAVASAVPADGSFARARAEQPGPGIAG